jgi:hypothetical protein
VVERLTENSENEGFSRVWYCAEELHFTQSGLIATREVESPLPTNRLAR